MCVRSTNLCSQQLGGVAGLSHHIGHNAQELRRADGVDQAWRVEASGRWPPAPSSRPADERPDVLHCRRMLVRWVAGGRMNPARSTGGGWLLSIHLTEHSKSDV